jgi:hypothetical protein
MKQLWGFAVATALVATALPAAPALADTRSNNAKEACNYRVRNDYSASTRNVSASERGYDRYSVSGQAQRNGETASFTCQTDGGSVQSLSIGSWKRGGGGGGGDAVAAVGIAVGLAAIIAAASSKKKNDNYDRYGQQDYYRNNSNQYNSNDNYNSYNNYNRNPQYNSDVFSPSGGIVCYRAQRACFDKHNNYDVRRTQREFNY